MFLNSALGFDRRFDFLLFDVVFRHFRRSFISTFRYPIIGLNFWSSVTLCQNSFIRSGPGLSIKKPCLCSQLEPTSQPNSISGPLLQDLSRAELKIGHKLEVVIPGESLIAALHESLDLLPVALQVVGHQDAGADPGCGDDVADGRAAAWGQG